MYILHKHLIWNFTIDEHLKYDVAISKRVLREGD